MKLNHRPPLPQALGNTETLVKDTDIQGFVVLVHDDFHRPPWGAKP